VAVTVALGDAAEGLVLDTGVAGRSAGEEIVGEGPGADGEQAPVRTTKEIAAMARRIPRPYVGRPARLVGHPSVLPDRKTYRHRN
jgi:hypothetical protein